MTMKRLRLLSGIVGSASLLSGPVLAEEAKTGLPQLDVSLFAGQLFWLVICFSILYVIVKRNIVPRYEVTLGTRQKMIEDGLAEASKANEEAKARQADYEKSLSEARLQAEGMVEAIAQKAAQETAQRQEAQQKDFDKRFSEAEARLQAFREASLKEAAGAAEELAKAMVDKVIGSYALTGGAL